MNRVRGLQRLNTGGDIVSHWEGLTMDIGFVFDWFTQESINAALEATQWEQREYWLRLALLWGAAAHERRKNAASTPPTTQPTSASS
jgi:hypothetical protein